ncbi:hypothetical protein HZ994_13995 [Akkermansiaceae bacterium]|nr:hypothetical protein HZ994_13995 [Akkermansiaceae bacterium]
MNPKIIAAALMLAAPSLSAATLKISANSTTRAGGEVEADYTTTHLFVDEVAGDSIPITVFFDPQVTNVESAEVFTNLDRRDRADDDANGDGIEDGILPPNGNTIAAGDDTHYYKAHTMALVSGGYQITLQASKTGAYRLTARYRLNGDAPGTYRYYANTGSGGKRDHAIVVSPVTAREIRLYEVNTLNIEASGTQFSQRSTFEDLSDRAGAIHTAGGRVNNWNLGYAQALGVNWLWFQPYHPYGWEGRHESAANINARSPGAGATTWRWNGGSPSEDVNYPFALGSPYAVKNFWEIDPRMSATFAGDPSNIADVGSQTNRDNAMQAFKNFVTDADGAGINIMPDAAFNHTAWDVELGEPGIATQGGNPNISWMAAQGATGWSKTDLIHDRELRVFSRKGDYRLRANSYNDFFNNNVASAPDRNDFGKWLDVLDIYFGRYAALVGAQDGSENNNYNNEGDWLDTTSYAFNGTDGGSFDAFTRATWKYFAQYAPYWLEKTRPANQNRNSLPGDGDAAARYAWDARGIDGLRCDFGQGLPPQCWEYIINVARSYKWSFVFMAETLDGGAPPYRSNRHFDILNENILFAAKGASNRNDFVSMFETRRSAFGQGLVLLNTVSHDEDNYANPWDAAARFAIFSTNDGAPMIFPGQELGISTFFGYDLMEKNFGKYIPHFKTYNSMMPLWSDTDFGNDQLFHVYSGINAARSLSAALRSSNRWFLNGDGSNNQIFSVAKYEQPGASPASKDVVLAFANLDRSNDQPDNFKIPAGLATLLGIKDTRTYNVRNIAAYIRPPAITGRRDAWQWGGGITGSALKSGGFTVNLKKVPTTAGAWDTAPYEAQYLKLYDVTPPPAPDTPVSAAAYAIGSSATFTWGTSAFTGDDAVDFFTVNGSVQAGIASVTLTGNIGDNLTAAATATSTAGITGPSSPASAPVKLLSSDGDEDGDGVTNATEDTAGTDPLDAASQFRISSLVRSGGEITLTVDGISGKTYRLWTSTSLKEDEWLQIGDAKPGNGAPVEFSHSPAPGDPKRFYRIGVE